MNSSSASPRDRHPLYTALVVLLSGCAVAAVLSFLGSLELQRQSHELLDAAIRICSRFPAAPDAFVCPGLARGGELLLTRGGLMLLLQGLCLALIVTGLGAVARRARPVLLQPAGPAPVSRMAAVAPPAGPGPGFGDRVAGAARDQGPLEAMRQTGRLLCSGPVSQALLLQALARLEAALGARTVALRLADDARQVLGAGPLLATHGVPTVAGQPVSEPRRTDAALRLIPPSQATPGRSLLVPVHCEGTPVAMLIAEFDPLVTVDDPRVALAESFAFLAALAISSVCRSQEERRVALMEERSAIAGELHDSLAQSLAFMKFQVAQLQRALDREHLSEEVTKAAQDLRGGLSAAYREVRELIAAFRVRMGPGGLVASVQETIEELGQRSGLEIRFEHELERCPLEVNEEFHVMQVIREALSNTVRHAAATRTWVSARYGPGHLFTVTVADDGRGLGASSPQDSHYGLSIMRERARSLGGDVSVGPRPGGGTQVVLSFAPQRIPTDPPRKEAAR